MIVDRTTLDVAPLAGSSADGRRRRTDERDRAGRNCVEQRTRAARHRGQDERPETAPRCGCRRFSGGSASHQRACSQPWNARLMPTGAHPWMNPDRDTHLWPHDDDAIYRRVRPHLRLPGSRLVESAEHAHQSAVQGRRRVRSTARGDPRRCCRLLPALAASTPYLDGRAHAASPMRASMHTRATSGACRRSPVASFPSRCASEAQYQQRDSASRCTAPSRRTTPTGILQFEWLNSHGAIARFDRQTIEIRVLDAQEHPGADLAIAQLVVASR